MEWIGVKKFTPETSQMSGPFKEKYILWLRLGINPGDKESLKTNILP